MKGVVVSKTEIATFLLPFRGGVIPQRYLRSVCKDTALKSQITALKTQRWGVIAKVG